ncbi:MAG: PaREP1 family protein [Dehalococcoidia bacterium]|nr:PaREP1 family protein [Dehalococcoidia bacterium]
MTLTNEHRAVSPQFMQQADEELGRGDQLQASEKAWGAAVRAVKPIAEHRGWQHDSHRHLFIAARRIAEENHDNEIRELFGVASSLHVNFYEGWMDLQTVVGNIDSVKRLLGKLDSLEDVPA